MSPSCELPDGEAGPSSWVDQTDAIDNPLPIALPIEEADRQAILDLLRQDLIDLNAQSQSDEAPATLPAELTPDLLDWWSKDHTRLGLVSRFMALILLLNRSVFWLPGLAGLVWVFTAIFSEAGFDELDLAGYINYGFKFLMTLVLWLTIAFTLDPFENDSPRTIFAWSRAVAIFIILVSFSLGYCALAFSATPITHEQAATTSVGPFIFCKLLQGWSTGPMPNVPESCSLRVEPNQAYLFRNAEPYGSQFARTYHEKGWCNDTAIFFEWDVSTSHFCCGAFDPESAKQVQDDETLCARGFQGNTDLYGLGIRCGVYLWISSLLANNFLPSRQKDTQRISLIFSLAICLATIITSMSGSCVFGIEIEIMHWIYWGGFVCVFASAPCPIRLGISSESSKWVHLDWTAFTLFITHWIMAYHGIWYVWRGYDQVFARMPCGTYHAFLGFVLRDPGEAFWAFRDWLGLVGFAFFPAVILVFPWTAILVMPELKRALLSSAGGEALVAFFGWGDLKVGQEPDDEGAPIEGQHQDECESTRSESHSKSLHRPLVAFWRDVRYCVRMLLVLPGSEDSRQGIYLVTPADLKRRWILRCRWATTGLASWIFSVAAIELMLHYNKVEGVYSLSSTGQYIPLIIAAASFTNVAWSLMKQEMERRRAIRCRRNVDDGPEDVEMSDVSGLSNALRHAFAKPDEEFMENGGVFPEDVDNVLVSS